MTLYGRQRLTPRQVKTFTALGFLAAGVLILCALGLVLCVWGWT